MSSFPAIGQQPPETALLAADRLTLLAAGTDLAAMSKRSKQPRCCRGGQTAPEISDRQRTTAGI